MTAFVLASLAVFMVMSAEGRGVWAGIALALAIQLKATPILLLAAPIVFRKWSTVIACIATCLIISACTIVDLRSAQVFIDFWNSIIHTVDDELFKRYVFNFDVNRALLAPLGVADQPLARWLGKAVLLFLAIAGTLSLHRRGDSAYPRAIAFLITCMVIVSPIVWYHHLAWILLPIAILSTNEASSTDARMKNLTISLGLYFLISQSMLLHFWTLKLGPSYLPITTLIPPLLLLTVAGAVYKTK